VKFVETPLAAIRTAKQSLYYAWFLHEAVERGAITPEAFTNEIPEGEMKLRWPPENRTPAALAGWSWNAVLAAMSISAIAADRALDDTFGLPRPRERTPLEPPDKMNDQDSARTIMYALRCAYAHDPLNPRWTCRRPYRGVFRIKDLGFALDTPALNGQPWNIAHVGGQLGYFKLLEYCQELVERGLSA